MSVLNNDFIVDRFFTDRVPNKFFNFDAWLLIFRGMSELASMVELFRHIPAYLILAARHPSPDSR